MTSFGEATLWKNLRYHRTSNSLLRSQRAWASRLRREGTAYKVKDALPLEFQTSLAPNRTPFHLGPPSVSVSRGMNSAISAHSLLIRTFDATYKVRGDGWRFGKRSRSRCKLEMSFSKKKMADRYWPNPFFWKNPTDYWPIGGNPKINRKVTEFLFSWKLTI